MLVAPLHLESVERMRVEAMLLVTESLAGSSSAHQTNRSEVNLLYPAALACCGHRRELQHTAMPSPILTLAVQAHFSRDAALCLQAQS